MAFKLLQFQMNGIVMGSHRTLVSKTFSTVGPITNIGSFLSVFVHMNLHLTLPATHVGTTSSLTWKTTFLVVVRVVTGIVVVAGDDGGGGVVVCGVS